MLGEFFAARSEQIDAGLLEAGPRGRFRVVEAKTVDPVSIATLGEILGVGVFDDLLDAASEGPIADHGEAGVFTMPDAVRDALASPQFEVEGAAARWGDTEELAQWTA